MLEGGRGDEPRQTEPRQGALQKGKPENTARGLVFHGHPREPRMHRGGDPWPPGCILSTRPARDARHPARHALSTVPFAPALLCQRLLASSEFKFTSCIQPSDRYVWRSAMSKAR